jgi:hypothetical protein
MEKGSLRLASIRPRVSGYRSAQIEQSAEVILHFNAHHFRKISLELSLQVSYNGMYTILSHDERFDGDRRLLFSLRVSKSQPVTCLNSLSMGPNKAET